jgi:HlyD family secretion protein
MNLSYRRMALPLVALAMAGLGFYHVNRESQSAPATAPPQSPPRSPYDNSIAASGVVEARTENIALGAALPGLVLEVYVPSDRVGTHVKAGQPLFRVDDRHLKAQLKVAEGQLASAEARLAKLEKQPRPEELPPSLAKVKATAANVARLQDPYERARRLIGTSAVAQEEYISRLQAYETAVQEHRQAQAEYELLKAGAWKPDIDVARASVREAHAQVEQVKTEIARATVVAPVDGVVLQVNVRAGERVSDQDAKALMVLGDISTYHVRVDIDERDIARFRRGAPGRAYPRGETAHEMTMRFKRVEPFVVPKKSLTGENTERVDTRVLQVLYAIERSEHPVYVGQQLDVFIDEGNAVADAPLFFPSPPSDGGESKKRGRPGEGK